MATKLAPLVTALKTIGQVETWQPIIFNDFSGGLIEDTLATNIEKNQFQLLQNFYIIADGNYLQTRGPFQPYFVSTSESILATAPLTFTWVNLNGTEILVTSRDAGANTAVEFWETGGTDEWVSILSSNLTDAFQVNYAVFSVNDAQDLIIANGKDTPLRWNDPATTGDDPATTTNKATNLGLTAPSIGTPAVTDTATADKRGLQFNGDYFYKVTAFFDDSGTTTKFGESGPSAASSGLTAAGADIGADTTVSMALSSLPAVASGTSKNNIYRSPPDQSDGPFLFIGSYSSGTTFTDETPVGEEGEEVPADAGTPPKLKFPIVANKRLWGVGQNTAESLGQKLVFSELDTPDMFLVANAFYLSEDITGIKEFNRDLYIYTVEKTFFLANADPSNSLLKISDRGCTSHNSIVDIGTGLVWQGKDNVYWADFNTQSEDGDFAVPIADGITKRIKGIAQNQRDNSVGVLYKERYYLSYTSTGSVNDNTIAWATHTLPLILAGQLRTAGWGTVTWAANYFNVFAPNALGEHLYTADDDNKYIQEHDVFGVADFLNFTDFGTSTSQNIVTKLNSKRFHPQDIPANSVYSSITIGTETTGVTFVAGLDINEGTFQKSATLVIGTGSVAAGTALYGSAVHGTDVYGASDKKFRQVHTRFPRGTKGRNAQLQLSTSNSGDTDIMIMILKYRPEPVLH